MALASPSQPTNVWCVPVRVRTRPLSGSSPASSSITSSCVASAMRRMLVQHPPVRVGERPRTFRFLRSKPSAIESALPGRVMALSQVETLLERDEAVAAVDQLIESAGRRDGSVLMVEAAAGVGKTAVLALARERARDGGLVVMNARGAELERDFAFGIVRQLLERLVSGLGGPERRELFAGAARLAAPLVANADRARASEPVPMSSVGQVAG